MQRLPKQPPGPYWLDLLRGVRVQVRPLTTPLYEAARHNSVRRAQELLANMADMESLGGSLEGMPDIRDPDQAVGVSQALFLQGLARAAIIRWEGVGDEDGNPLDPTPNLVDRFMLIHDQADAFYVRYCGSYEQREAEGNASGAAPTGTTAAAPDTAKDAETAAPPAPTVSAA